MDQPAPTSSKENVPIDLDEFPSLHAETVQTDLEGVPQTILTTPYDDLSTIANDTIGHTVHPWDDLSGQGYHRYHNNYRPHQKRPQNGRLDFVEGDGVEPPHSRLPPVLREDYDGDDNDEAVWYDYPDQKTNPSTVVSGSSQVQNTAFQTHNKDNKPKLSENDNERSDEEKRRFRCYVIIAIVGPLVSAIIVGLTVALLMRDNGKSTVVNRNIVGNETLIVVAPTTKPTVAPWIRTNAPILSTTTPPNSDETTVEPKLTAMPTVLNTQSPTSALISTLNPTILPTTTPPIATPIPTFGPTFNPTSQPTLSPTINVQRLTPIQSSFVDVLRARTSSTDYWQVAFKETVSRDTYNVEDLFSSQWRALEWLTADPNYNEYSNEQRIQRYSLAVLAFSAMEGGRIPTVLQEGGWLDYAVHECDWYMTTGAPQCRDGRNLYRLELRNLGLSGSLPVELGLLSNSVRQLYLQGNNWSGTLPTIWGRDFSDLQRLQLTNGNLEGTLPSEWQSMTSLLVLGLGRNQLVGTLPSEWAISTTTTTNRSDGMMSLSTLGLERNALTGFIPDTWGNGRLPSLTELYLDFNQLVGTVPDSLWSSSTTDGIKNQWEAVNLGGNPLSGTISDITCNIPSLIELVANCNSGDTLECACCTECT